MPKKKSGLGLMLFTGSDSEHPSFNSGKIMLGVGFESGFGAKYFDAGLKLRFSIECINEAREMVSIVTRMGELDDATFEQFAWDNDYFKAKHLESSNGVLRISVCLSSKGKRVLPVLRSLLSESKRTG